MQTSKHDNAEAQRGSTLFPSLRLLGLTIHAMTKYDLVEATAQAIVARKRCVIANHNLHSFYCWSKDASMRNFYAAADYVHIDGMPLVWLGRILGLPLRGEHRATYLDFLPVLATAAEAKQWRVFYLGSQPNVMARAQAVLAKTYPDLQLAMHHGFFSKERDGAENQAVLQSIREYAPDILIIGMGMPRQEAWAFENLEELSATAIFCCGGLMDIIAGEIPTPPRWFGSAGFEWLFRLLSRPRRTWRRYLVEPWFLVAQVCREYVRTGHPYLRAEKQ